MSNCAELSGFPPLELLQLFYGLFKFLARLTIGRLSFAVLRLFDWRESRVIIGMHPDPSTRPLLVLL